MKTNDIITCCVFKLGLCLQTRKTKYLFGSWIEHYNPIQIKPDRTPSQESPPTNRYPTHFRTPDNESIYGKEKNAIFQKVNNSNKSRIR